MKKVFLLILSLCLFVVGSSKDYQTNRKRLEERKFTSTSVNTLIDSVKPLIKDDKLRWMFENSFPNTLDETVTFTVKNGKPDTYIITGDIDAMWLRDCVAQIWPYFSEINRDPQLKELIRGLIFRLSSYVNLDPYANAFNYDNSNESHWKSDHTNKMSNDIHERKWEIDGLCYVVRLSYEYWKKTGDITVFDEEWNKAMKNIVATFKTQQRKENRGDYYFMRTTDRATDGQIMLGYGAPLKPVGLIASMFRPSDDATVLPFLIPSNCFAVTSLTELSEMYKTIFKDATFSKVCGDMSLEVKNAIEKYGIVKHPTFGEVYAFEVDGFGNALFMDDANVPSLLSMPYLGYLDKSDKIYQNTRNFIWSENNPYFYKNNEFEGIGGPHVGKDNMIWPMSMIMKALTSTDSKEITHCLKMLVNSDAGTGFMHESFNKNDPKDFTRSWFAWTNTLFGELIVKIAREKKDILKEVFAK